MRSLVRQLNETLFADLTQEENMQEEQKQCSLVRTDKP